MHASLSLLLLLIAQPGVRSDCTCEDTQSDSNGILPINYGTGFLEEDINCSWKFFGKNKGAGSSAEPYCDLVLVNGDFDANENCCSCGGGTFEDDDGIVCQPSEPPTGTPIPTAMPTVTTTTCEDTDHQNAKGIFLFYYGTGHWEVDCRWEFFGENKGKGFSGEPYCDVVLIDDDFEPRQMCCACGGGKKTADGVVLSNGDQRVSFEPTCTEKEEGQFIKKFKKNGRKKKTKKCKWLMNQQQNKRDKYCDDDSNSARNVCPVTCNVCEE